MLKSRVIEFKELYQELESCTKSINLAIENQKNNIRHAETMLGDFLDAVEESGHTNEQIIKENRSTAMNVKAYLEDECDTLAAMIKVIRPGHITEAEWLTQTLKNQKELYRQFYKVILNEDLR